MVRNNQFDCHLPKYWAQIASIQSTLSREIMNFIHLGKFGYIGIDTAAFLSETRNESFKRVNVTFFGMTAFKLLIVMDRQQNNILNAFFLSSIQLKVNQIIEEKVD
jgi:hypothetical protein